jgi:single-strand DNA-binding protein
MSGVNKVILIGNLGQDPETGTTPGGNKFARLSIATSESWRDKQTGDRRERTEWHRVVIWSEGLAKVAEQYLAKGAKVYVEGKLQTRKWQDQNGNDRYSTEIILTGFNAKLIMLGSRNGNHESAGGQAGDHADGGRQTAAGGSPADADTGFEPPFDDEVPF